MSGRYLNLHVVISGNLSSAILDWSDRLKALDRHSLDGVDRYGRAVRFVSVDTPDKLRGLRITSYEVHWTAIGARGLAKCAEICARRVALLPVLSRPDVPRIDE